MPLQWCSPPVGLCLLGFPPMVLKEVPMAKFTLVLDLLLDLDLDHLLCLMVLKEVFASALAAWGMFSWDPWWTLLFCTPWGSLLCGDLPGQLGDWGC